MELGKPDHLTHCIKIFSLPPLTIYDDCLIRLQINVVGSICSYCYQHFSLSSYTMSSKYGKYMSLVLCGICGSSGRGWCHRVIAIIKCGKITRVFLLTTTYII